MTTPISPAWLGGTSDGRLYLIDAAGTSAFAISVADYEVLTSNGYPTYEVSDRFLNSLRTIGGSGK